MSNATLTPHSAHDDLAPTTHRFGFYDEDDNLGVIGRGASIDSALESAAYAVAALMDDGTGMRPERTHTFEFAAAEPAQALVTWLNRVIALATHERLTLCLFQVHHVGTQWCGSAWGAPSSESRSMRRPVRGARPAPVSVTPTGSGWEARCLLDW